MRITFLFSYLVFLTACSLADFRFLVKLPAKNNHYKQGSYKGSYYIVKKGDTLDYIAYITNRSVDAIASANGIVNPNKIYVGQKLNLWFKTYVAPVYGVRQPSKTLSSPSIKVPPIIKPTPSNNTGIQWQWPTKGKIVANFSNEDSGNKGIDIAGIEGQEIAASADGKVVYSGSALRGYGNLLIIKHNNDYLSAYAHNESLLVEENQVVKKGQKIATMGSTGADSVRLHFEIRYRGQSVNPNRYLP